MYEVLGFFAVCLLVAFVILRAYAARSLIHLRRRAGEIVGEEKQAKRARDQEEQTLESLEVKVAQLHDDVARRRQDQEALQAEVEQADTELQRVRGEDEEQAARIRSREMDK